MVRPIEFPGKDAPTPALIAHIVERYHATHRRELPELIALGRKVETAHADDPNAPHGLTHALEALIVDLEVHMREEEENVFAAVDFGRPEKAVGPIAALHHDHSGQEATLNKIAAITHGFRLPSYACGSWTRLYAGLGKLVEDMDEHMFLEDTVLFPRLEDAA